MKLNRVDILNFRSIDKLTVDFSKHNCQALIGINESGKSNILRALHLLDPGTALSPADLRIERHDEPQVTSGYVRFVFTLSEKELEEVYELVKINFADFSLDELLVADGDSNFNLREWCLSRSEGLYRVDFPSGNRVQTTWGVKVTEQIQPNWFRNVTGEPILLGHAGKTFVVPAKGLVLLHDGIDFPPAPFEKATLKDINSVLVVAIGKVISTKIPKCIFWRYADQYLLPSTIDVSAFCASPDSCIPLKSMFELAGYDCENLASTISTAQSQGHYRYVQILEKTAQAATRHIQSVWKDYKSVRIKLEPNGATLSPVIVDDVIPLDMANRSDGFKRFVSFLLQISAKVRTEELQDTLILVDEPEIGLHPTGARSLMRELVKIGETNYVVYSTHSIFMIDKEEIGRHLVVEKKKEVTTTWRAEKSRIQDEEVLYGAIGYSIFESLKEKNIIFEGWRDKEIFKAVADAMGKNNKEIRDQLAGIGMVFAEGVKDVKNVAHFLQLASRPCLIISDADKAALQHRKAYMVPGAWGSWKTLQELMPDTSVVTGEDLLTKAAVVKRSNKFRTTIANLGVLTEEFFNAGEATMAGLRRWLESAGLAGTPLEEALNELKSAIFDGLKRAEISDEAEQLVTFVLNYEFTK